MNNPNPRRQRCGAKTKSTDDGHPCRRWGMPNGRCNLHGGKSLAGAQAPNFKTGKYSKYLPENLLAVYQGARTDPDLLSNRETIALLDARIADLLSQLSTGSAVGIWDRLVDQWDQFMAAGRAKDGVKQRAAAAELERIINDGATDAAKWRELYRVMDSRRRGVDSEQRIKIAHETLIPMDRTIMYLTFQIESIKEALKKHVDNDETEKRIIDAAVAANRRLLGATNR